MSDFQVKELYQEDLESFEDKYWELRDKIKRDKIGNSTEEGIVLRAAFLAGWFGNDYVTSDPPPDTRVKKMKPVQIVKLAKNVSDAREVARHISPFSLFRLVCMSFATQTRLDLFKKLGALKHGETLTVKGGENGELEILRDTTTA
jgi:hypothetical protein